MTPEIIDDRHLEELSRRVGALEECVRVLRGVEERVCVLGAAVESLKPKRRRPGRELAQRKEGVA